MAIKAVLFDLDGTLLPMDLECFTNAYFKGLVRRAAPLGYDPKKLTDGIMAGTAAMVRNDGSKTNAEVFWDVLASFVGDRIRDDAYIFDAFYEHEFQDIRTVCGYSPSAREVTDLVKELGFTAVLATNPLFPRIATESRVRWAGLDIGDFAQLTSYETSRYCKPNPDYYRDLLRELDLDAGECLMVGNDAHEDMIAETLGMQVFLLTDCLINRRNADISRWPNGGFADLKEYLYRCAEA